MNEVKSEPASTHRKRDRDLTATDSDHVRTSVFKKHGKRQKLAVDDAGEVIYCPVQADIEVIELSDDVPEKRTELEKTEVNLKSLSHNNNDNYDSDERTHNRSCSPSSASSDHQLSRIQQDYDPTSVHATQQRVFVSAHEKYYSAAYAHLAEKHAEELHDLIFNHIDKKGLNLSETDDESDKERDRDPLDPKEGIKHTEEHSDNVHSHGDDYNDNVRSQNKDIEERVRRGSPDYRPDANHLAQTNTFTVNVPDVHDYDNAQYNDDQAHSQYRYDTERSHRGSHNYGYETYDDRHTPLDYWHEKDRRDSFHDYHRSSYKDWHDQDRQESSHERHRDPLNNWHEDNQRNSFHENHYAQAEDWHEYDRRNPSRDYRYTSYDDWRERDHRNSSTGNRHTQHEVWHEQDRRDSFHDHHRTQHEDWYERDHRAHGYHHGRDSYAEYYHEQNYGRYYSRDHDAGHHDEDYHGHYRGRDNRAHHHNEGDHGLGRERSYHTDYSREDDRGHDQGQDNYVDRHDEDPFVMHHRGKEECEYARREYDRGFYHEEDDYVEENPYTTDENRRRRQSSISSTGAKSIRSLVDTINLPHLKMGVFPLHASRIFVPAPSNAALAMEHHEWAILITSALADTDVAEIASPLRQTIRYDLARYIGRLLSRHLLSAVPLRPLPTQPGGHADPVKIVLGYASREGREDALWILQKERPYLMSEHSRLELSAWKLEGENKLQPGTASVKWCEREYNGYQSGLKEAENIENAMDGVPPGYGRWWGRDGMFHITSE